MTITVTGEEQSLVVVEVIDKYDRKEAYRARHKKGDVKEVTIEGYGIVHVKIFFNGQLKIQRTF